MNPFTGRSSEHSPSEPPEYFLDEEETTRPLDLEAEDSPAARARKRWLTGLLQACKVLTGKKNKQ